MAMCLICILSNIHFSFQAGSKRLIDNKPNPLVNEDDFIRLCGSEKRSNRSFRGFENYRNMEVPPGTRTNTARAAGENERRASYFFSFPHGSWLLPLCWHPW